MPRYLRSVATTLAALALAGCGWITPPVDDPGEAVGGPPAVAELVVDRWLAGVSGGDGDLGWGLLYPNLRQDLFGGEAAYRASVADADWTGFTWSVENTGLRDGEYRVRVVLHGKVTAIEGFLSDWGILQVDEVTDDGAYHGFIVVRIGVGGEPSGIQATG